MFTGIVEDTGEVLAVEDDAGGRRVRISTTFEDLAHGQSISVSGACLTVEEYEPGEWFSVFLAAETIDRTFFDSLAEGTVSTSNGRCRPTALRRPRRPGTRRCDGGGRRRRVCWRGSRERRE